MSFFPDWQQRTALLFGEAAVSRLNVANVLVAGLGGVGSFAAEALVRSGVGKMTIIDADTVDTTNRNRQLPALSSTLGRLKTEVMTERLLDINPELDLTALPIYIGEETLPALLSQPFDYIVDAIDSLSPKAFLIAGATARGIPLIVSLGSAGKLDPSLVSLVTLNQTHGCPLARALRYRLKKVGTDHSKVRCVFSPEHSTGTCTVYPDETTDDLGKRSTRGTAPYLPPIFGLFAASEVIRNLTAPIG